MPEHLCVQCYSCGTFQVQQAKQTNKFQCRVCGEKQSVRKVFAKSDKAKDVRIVVQSLNMKRGEAESATEPTGHRIEYATPEQNIDESLRKVNWNEYLPQDDATEGALANPLEREEDWVDGDDRYTTCMPDEFGKRKRCGKARGSVGGNSSRLSKRRRDTCRVTVRRSFAVAGDEERQETRQTRPSRIIERDAGGASKTSSSRKSLRDQGNASTNSETAGNNDSKGNINQQGGFDWSRYLDAEDSQASSENEEEIWDCTGNGEGSACGKW